MALPAIAWRLGRRGHAQRHRMQLLGLFRTGRWNMRAHVQPAHRMEFLAHGSRVGHPSWWPTLCCHHPEQALLGAVFYPALAICEAPVQWADLLSFRGWNWWAKPRPKMQRLPTISHEKIQVTHLANLELDNTPNHPTIHPNSNQFELSAEWQGFPGQVFCSSRQYVSPVLASTSSPKTCWSCWRTFATCPPWFLNWTPGKQSPRCQNMRRRVCIGNHPIQSPPPLLSKSKQLCPSRWLACGCPQTHEVLSFAGSLDQQPWPWMLSAHNGPPPVESNASWACIRAQSFATQPRLHQLPIPTSRAEGKEPPGMGQSPLQPSRQKTGLSQPYWLQVPATQQHETSWNKWRHVATLSLYQGICLLDFSGGPSFTAKHPYEMMD